MPVGVMAPVTVSLACLPEYLVTVISITLPIADILVLDMTSTPVTKENVWSEYVAIVSWAGTPDGVKPEYLISWALNRCALVESV